MDLDIRFYDNEDKNWTADMIQHHPPVTFIEVDNITPNVYIEHVQVTGKPTKKNTQETYNRAYIEFFASQGNTYAQFLKKIIDGGGDTDKFLNKDYPTNGVQSYLDELVVWAQSKNGGQKCVIFDWDKTITAVEGMFFDEYNGESIMNHSVEQIAQFSMGGPDRMSQVQRMISMMRESGTPIFVITNNPNASIRTNTRGLYLALISLIFGVSQEEANSIIYCSKDHGFKKWKSACAIRTLTPYLRSCVDGASSFKPSSVADSIMPITQTIFSEVKPPTVRKIAAKRTAIESHIDVDDVESGAEKKAPVKRSYTKKASNVGSGIRFRKKNKSVRKNRKARTKRRGKK